MRARARRRRWARRSSRACRSISRTAPAESRVKLGPRASAEVQIERDAKLRLVLFFGPDSGLAHERAKALVARVAGDARDPFRVSEFAAAALKDEPSRLMDEAASLSLTGGRRAVWLREAGDARAGGAA